jgi:hypothetical protein
MADTMQQYETLCIVISAALGGKKTGSDSKAAPQTSDELEAALQRALG